MTKHLFSKKSIVIVEDNVWDLIINESKSLKLQADAILALKKFIQSTDNGFLLHTQLQKLIDLPNYFSNATDILPAFEAHIRIANLILSQATSIFDRYPQTQLEKIIIQLKSGMSKPKNNHEINDHLVAFLEESLLSNFSPMNFKTERKVFYVLFYPYIDEDYDISSEHQNYIDVIHKLKAYMFNCLSTPPDEFNYQSAWGNMYDGMSHASKQYFIDHFQFEDKDGMSSAEEIFVTIEEKIDELRDLLSDEKEINQLLKEYKELTTIDVTFDDMKLSISESISRLKHIKYFFSLFLEKEDDCQTGSGRNKAPAHDGTRKIRSGFVLLNHEGKTAYQEVGIPKHAPVRQAKVIQTYISQGHRRLVESQGITILVDEISPCSTTNPLVKVTSGKSKSHHIALYAQFLLQGSTPSDVKHAFNGLMAMLDNIDQRLSKHDVQTINVLMSLWLFFMTGREVKTIYLDHISDKLSLHEVCLIDDGKFILMPIDAYVYKTSRNESLYAQTRSNSILLKIPTSLHVKINPIMIALVHAGYTKIQGVSLLAAKDIVNTPIDIKMIKDFVTRSLLKASGGDLWLSALIHGDIKSVGETQKHYASCQQQKVQRVFNQHVDQFTNKVSRVRIPDPEMRIGSLFFIREEPFINLLRIIRIIFYRCQKRYKNSILFADDVVHLFNLLSFYTDTILSFVTGTRNVTNPYVNLDTINQKNWTVINDKNIFDGYNTRWVYVPKEIQNHLIAFEKIRDDFIRRLTDRGHITGIVRKKTEDQSEYAGFAKKHDLFLFRVSNNSKRKLFLFTPTPYTRSKSCQYAYNALNHFNIKNVQWIKTFKSNSNRHYLRGKLMDLDVDPFYIDSYLGHWHTGTEPWGRNSLFNIEHYQSQLSTAIDHIAKALTLKSLSFIQAKVFHNKRKKETDSDVLGDLGHA